MPQRLDLILRSAPKGRVSKDAPVPVRFFMRPSMGEKTLPCRGGDDPPKRKGHPRLRMPLKTR